MDYENKYKEAIERAKKWRNAPNVDKIPTYANRIIEEIFPELRESEDERIRKALIKYFTLSDDNADYQCCGVHCKDIVAWLEKQGEKAKYHDICDTCVRQPTCQSDCFLQQNEQKHNPVLDIEIPFGAKDSELQEASYYIPEGFHAEIEGNKVIIKKGEQKPWSEKDDEMIDSIIEEVRYIGDFPDYPTKEENELYDECLAKVDWLKSLKDRFVPQVPEEWSEEDKLMLMSCIEIMQTVDSTEEQQKWLKSLRTHSQWKQTEEQIKTCKKVYADILSAKGFDLGTVNGELNRLEEELKKLKG